MAIWNIHYVCGCGYKTKDSDEAEKHADKSGHKVLVAGFVDPSGPTKAQLRKKAKKVGYKVSDDAMVRMDDNG